MDFEKRDIDKLTGNVFDAVGNGWMLITAEKDGKVNTMTASWGGFGVLWGKRVAFVFIRPQRYTYEFTENSDRMTLSFFDEKYRKALSYLGTHSGRDSDKIAEAGLNTKRVGGEAAFTEASAVMVCRKLYADDLKEECFLDEEALLHYEKKDYHRVYVVEVESVYTK